MLKGFNAVKEKDSEYLITDFSATKSTAVGVDLSNGIKLGFGFNRIEVQFVSPPVKVFIDGDRTYFFCKDKRFIVYRKIKPLPFL